MLSVTKNLAPRLLIPVRSKVIRDIPLSTTAALNAHDENDPMLTLGPYPRTKEERERAAKKYNLIPEDYEPYPEEEALGDYPMLKAIGNFNRDPYDDFDDVVGYKFYGEVYHKDADLYEWERVDPLAHEKTDLPLWQKAMIFFGLAFSLPTYMYLMKKFRIQINHPWKMRHPDFLVPKKKEVELWAFSKS